MPELLKARLESFGYEVKESDLPIMRFCIDKVTSTIENECNIKGVPEGLKHISVDMAAGEFLKAKKTFSPSDISGLDLNAAVKQIQVGDTNTVFSYGEGCQTAEARLDALIDRLLTCGREEFSCYRKIRW